jgi:hypothetical protein
MSLRVNVCIQIFVYIFKSALFHWPLCLPRLKEILVSVASVNVLERYVAQKQEQTKTFQ